MDQVVNESSPDIAENLTEGESFGFLDGYVKPSERKKKKEQLVIVFLFFIW